MRIVYENFEYTLNQVELILLAISSCLLVLFLISIFRGSKKSSSLLKVNFLDDLEFENDPVLLSNKIITRISKNYEYSSYAYMFINSNEIDFWLNSSWSSVGLIRRGNISFFGFKCNLTLARLIITLAADCFFLSFLMPSYSKTWSWEDFLPRPHRFYGCAMKNIIPADFMALCILADQFNSRCCVSKCRKLSERNSSV